MKKTNFVDRKLELAQLEEQLFKSTDTESSLDILRKFKNAQWRRVSDAEAAGILSPPATYQILTTIAEITLTAAADDAYRLLGEKLAPPRGRYGIIAMGKFGGLELTYGSDLDIIFLTEFLEDQEFFVRLGQKIISHMGIITREGYAYKVDTELRPSGRSGVLVSSLPSFREYHKKMAMLWEHQALIKARPLIGEANFLKEAGEFIHQVVYQKRSPDIGTEIRRLRLRMELELAREKEGQFDVKVGRGGLVDIEFLVQYLQLLHGWDHPALQTTQTLTALRQCSGAFLTPEETQDLESAYLFYRSLETKLRQATGQKTSLVIVGSQLVSASDKDHLLKTRKRVRGVFDKVIYD